MSKIDLKMFKGMVPRFHPKRLPPEAAILARNVELSSGVIKPFEESAADTSIAGSGWKTIYRFDTWALWWDSVVDVVRSRGLDAEDKIFYTGDGTPKQLLKSEITGHGKPGVDEYRPLGIRSPNHRPELTPYYTWRTEPYWASGTSYKANDIVKIRGGNLLLKCIKGHTSPTGAEYSRWTEAGAFIYIGEHWKPTPEGEITTVFKFNKRYEAGDCIGFGNWDIPFRCKIDHKSDDGMSHFVWDENEAYKIGSVVKKDDEKYVCIQEHEERHEPPNTDYWTPLSSATEWDKNTAYDAGDLVLFQDEYYVCKDSHSPASLEYGIASISGSASGGTVTVTVTTDSNHGLNVGDKVVFDKIEQKYEKPSIYAYYDSWNLLNGDVVEITDVPTADSFEYETAEGSELDPTNDNLFPEAYDGGTDPGVIVYEGEWHEPNETKYWIKRIEGRSPNNKPGGRGNWERFWNLTNVGNYLETVSYVFTYVTDLGEESAPSVPSLSIDSYEKMAIHLTDFPNQPERGTVYVVAAALSTVKGAGTNFTDIFAEGDYIYVNDGATEAQLRIVDSITNDTELTVTDPFDHSIPTGSRFRQFPARLRYIRLYRLTTSQYGTEYRYVPFWFAPLPWKIGRKYYQGQYVRHPKGDWENPDFDIYKCMSDHVASETNCPGYGADWETYWDSTDWNFLVNHEQGMHVNLISQGYWDVNVEADGLGFETPITMNQSLGENLPTEDWDPPPSDLKGLRLVSNSSLVGFTNNQLWFSEPYAPYAWPEKYMVELDYEIVALAVYKFSLIVLTEGYPYIITGTSPDSISRKVLPIPQGCLSARGVVETEIGVIYPCSDGLYLINESGGEPLTKELFGKKDWEDLSPGNWVSTWYEKKYLAFSETRSIVAVFDFGELLTKQGSASINVGGGVSFSPIDFVRIQYTDVELESNHTCQGISHDVEYNRVYWLDKDEGDGSFTIRFWSGGAAVYKDYTWTSKVFEYSREISFGCARILGTQDSDNPATITIYCNGAQVLSKNVSDEDIFRIPAKRGKEWQVKLEGTPKNDGSRKPVIEQVLIANAPSEIPVDV